MHHRGNAITILRAARNLILLAVLSIGCLAIPARAITIDIDYTYDTTHFFSHGNPQGAAAGNQARAALEAAAGYFSNILNDTFAAITTPAPIHSSVSSGMVTFNWKASFDHPSTNAPIEFTNPPISANQYVIYAGARSLGNSELGIGGPGGWESNPVLSGTNSFTAGEINQIEQRSSNFEDLLEFRGESSGFARWGGAITFDNDSSTTWHLNHAAPVVAGRSDLFSVAVHELGHALGLGASDQWSGLVSGSYFTGSGASLEYGGLVPLGPGGGHWAEGTMSTLHGTAISQEAAMDPAITTGSRKRFTDLDAAAMKDIGWTVIAPPGLDGDYNANGIVDAADYTLWRDNLNKSVPAGTGADGDNNGNIGPGDYNVWKSNFGASVTGSASASGAFASGITASTTASDAAVSASAAVPEPTTSALILVGASMLLAGRYRMSFAAWC